MPSVIETKYEIHEVPEQAYQHIELQNAQPFEDGEHKIIITTEALEIGHDNIVHIMPMPGSEPTVIMVAEDEPRQIVSVMAENDHIVVEHPESQDQVIAMQTVGDNENQDEIQATKDHHGEYEAINMLVNASMNAYQGLHGTATAVFTSQHDRSTS